jgi:hypothetical protein
MGEEVEGLKVEDKELEGAERRVGASERGESAGASPLWGWGRMYWVDCGGDFVWRL